MTEDCGCGPKDAGFAICAEHWPEIRELARLGGATEEWLDSLEVKA